MEGVIVTFSILFGLKNLYNFAGIGTSVYLTEIFEYIIWTLLGDFGSHLRCKKSSQGHVHLARPRIFAHKALFPFDRMLN